MVIMRCCWVDWSHLGQVFEWQLKFFFYSWLINKCFNLSQRKKIHCWDKKKSTTFLNTRLTQDGIAINHPSTPGPLSLVIVWNCLRRLCKWEKSDRTGWSLLLRRLLGLARTQHEPNTKTVCESDKLSILLILSLFTPLVDDFMIFDRRKGRNGDFLGSAEKALLM